MGFSVKTIKESGVYNMNSFISNKSGVNYSYFDSRLEEEIIPDLLKALGITVKQTRNQMIEYLSSLPFLDIQEIFPNFSPIFAEAFPTREEKIGRVKSLSGKDGIPKELDIVTERVRAFVFNNDQNDDAQKHPAIDAFFFFLQALAVVIAEKEKVEEDIN